MVRKLEGMLEVDQLGVEAVIGGRQLARGTDADGNAYRVMVALDGRWLSVERDHIPVRVVRLGKLVEAILGAE